MAITSGFFSSLNGDRKYSSKQISEMFEGIIRDGIFQFIGNKFDVRASNGLSVTVGSGKAWFDGIWIKNDSTYTQSIDPADQLLPRMDRIVIDVDSSEAVRAATVKYLKGTPNKSPKPVNLIKDSAHKQYSICTIYVSAGATSLSNDNIKITTGTNETPFITGPLETVKMDWVIREWESMIAKKDDKFNTIINNKSATYEKDLQNKMSRTDQWLKDINRNLSGDAATNLANELYKTNQKIDNNMNTLGNTIANVKIHHERLELSYAPVKSGTMETIHANKPVCHHIWFGHYHIYNIQCSVSGSSGAIIGINLPNRPMPTGFGQSYSGYINHLYDNTNEVWTRNPPTVNKYKPNGALYLETVPLSGSYTNEITLHFSFVEGDYNL